MGPGLPELTALCQSHPPVCCWWRLGRKRESLGLRCLQGALGKQSMEQLYSSGCSLTNADSSVKAHCGLAPGGLGPCSPSVLSGGARVLGGKAVTAQTNA